MRCIHKVCVMVIVKKKVFITLEIQMVSVDCMIHLKQIWIDLNWCLERHLHNNSINLCVCDLELKFIFPRKHIHTEHIPMKHRNLNKNDKYFYLLFIPEYVNKYVNNAIQFAVVFGLPRSYEVVWFAMFRNCVH